MKNEIIANKAVTDWIDRLWERARTSLLRSARNPEEAMAGRFGDALRQLGRAAGDAHLKATINRSRGAPRSARRPLRDSIVTLVSDTISGWDARTVTDRLEGAVGRDLQYIRINGTLVGGLVGLLIHSFEVWFWRLR